MHSVHVVIGSAGPETCACLGLCTTYALPVCASSADRIATLREAFRRTPKWLGFNIEVGLGRLGRQLWLLPAMGRRCTAACFACCHSFAS